MKFAFYISKKETEDVTPCVGVWIEILSKKIGVSEKTLVTPCVGVWIEILQSSGAVP